MGQQNNHKKKSINLTDLYRAYTDEEDGSKDFKKSKIITISIIAILILIAIIIYNAKLSNK